MQKILGHSQIDTTMQYAMVNQNNENISSKVHELILQYLDEAVNLFVEMFGDPATNPMKMERNNYW